MLTDVIRFAVLGLGAGAIYGLSALGIVLIYRGSGILNFSQGAVGMVGAYVFYLQRENGMATPPAALLAIGVGLLIGALVHQLVMRPLRDAPPVSRLIATLGVFAFLFGLGQYLFGVGQARIVGSILPDGSTTVLPGIRIGTDRLAILAAGIVLAAALTVVYRSTRFGLATSAVAENGRASSALGISPDTVATVNWMIGCALAVVSAVLIVSIGTLQVENLAMLIVPALAAALLGGFRSFPLTMAGGLLIGMLESEVAWIGTRQHADGWGQTVPFIVIILVLVISGRSLPLRGEAIQRPPQLGTGIVRPPVLIGAGLVALGLLYFVFPPALLGATEITLALGLVVLSLVVVTGYTGQLSLAQMALAGMGAWIAARLVADHGVPFWAALLIGVAGAVPVGIVVGLPALRTRGMNLAVVTLCLAVVLEHQIFSSTERTGGFTGINVGSPKIFGVDMDTYFWPSRYAIFCLVLFILAALMVANLRRGRAGRRLVAVRSNERAAASIGISVARAKIFAFGISAALAAAGGVLLSFRQPNVTFVPTYTAFQSIFAVVFSIIGGVGYLIGAVIGAMYAPAGLLSGVISQLFPGTAFAQFISRNEVGQMILGLTLLLVLPQLPNGLATQRLPGWMVPGWVKARGGRRVSRRDRAELAGDTAFTVVERPVDVRALTVRFGGVTALDDVALKLVPGEVHGLIGPNGAGKTTLIDALTGFVDSPGAGLTLDGQDISRWPAQRRAAAGISRSFQSLELFETMTVRENLLAACDRQDWPAFVSNLVRPGRDRYSPAALAAIREFRLEDDLERKPDELPYGRRRLLAIARSVATGSSVLLLDEPAAGLDDAETAELGRLIRRLATELRMAVLLVEHNVSVVLDVSDRVSVLNFGKLIATGTPAEIRNDPAVITAYLGDAKKPAPVAVTDREPVHPAGEPLVEARGLSAGYGDLAAVRDLDLVVRPGEIVALLGPNGAGKTTTLLTLAGELKPLAGTVRWRGSPAAARLHRRAREGMAFVPEERSVFMQLSTAENLRLGRGPRAAALDAFPELTPLLDRRAGLLSGGEQQILTLARALAGRPALLLADELSLGLAPLVVDRLLRAIRRAADEGLGVLLVEQQAARALEVADRAYVLRRGRVITEGPAAELARDWSNLERSYLSEVAGG
ncbi:ABC transporter permease subunit [Dactylosporangium matsuzakiense]|uniref:ABC transporter n=1 Tax=Dactylosporangium matsuzakiense TaxID=53360 RepID=A0A9W6NJ99_9ACTN|nr:ATP-binding cassette domain-containing protein [Dactylosporangium matsuzakiense]UWZ47114.1 ATP-binding cassette domain-containing protein [Dactylosporangium matsuzakiense]GLK98451.1 ABC transporter [Dactylosporangium matsuzakiense]